MIAAIYARKSTEQTGLAEEQKSVARQIEHARHYAARKGWTVDESSIFLDDGISGAEFANRPGFLRLMNALKPRPAFQVLVMSEESRLGREAIETAYALKQLVTAGVRVFFYLEDRERTLDSPTDKIMLSLTAFADELEREKARQRTADAMIRKARAGHVCGGAVFGYENVDVTAPGGKRSHVVRRIVEREAAVVRRIFELCAAGDGLKSIVKRLNAERAPAPRSQQGRPRAWAPSSVRDVLYRDTYRGLLTWNKTKKRDTWGQKCWIDRPASEWIRVPAEDLRIVPDALWNAAQAQLTERRETYRVANRLEGRTTLDIRGSRPSYLLSGFGRCGCCGGSMQVVSRRTTAGRDTNGAQRYDRLFRYGCGQRQSRGDHLCANVRLARLDEVDAEIRALLATEVLDPNRVEAALERAVAMLRKPASSPADRTRVSARLRDVERQLANYTAAIAKGGAVPAVLDALNRAEAERQALERELARLKASRREDSSCPDTRTLRRTLSGYLDDWHGMIQGNVTEARHLLSVVLRERITFTPIVGDAGAPMYELKIPIAFDRLLVAVVPGLEVGFARVGLASPTATRPIPRETYRLLIPAA